MPSYEFDFVVRLVVTLMVAVPAFVILSNALVNTMYLLAGNGKRFEKAHPLVQFLSIPFILFLVMGMVLIKMCRQRQLALNWETR